MSNGALVVVEETEVDDLCKNNRIHKKSSMKKWRFKFFQLKC